MRRAVWLSSILVAAIAAGNLKAETILEQFKPDSGLFVVEEANSASTFSYSPEGYVTCTVSRNNIAKSMGAYYKKLDTRIYAPSTSGYWIGFDYSPQAGSSGASHGHIGLFNADANYVYQTPGKLNAIALEPKDYGLAIRVEYNNGSGNSTSNEAGATAALTNGTSYRIVMKVYQSGVNVLADLIIYQINADGTLTTFSNILL